MEEQTKDKFYEWFMDDELSDEKDAALLRLWDETENVITEDTLDSLASLKFKSRFRKEKKGLKSFVWRYVAAIIIMVFITSTYILTKRTPVETDFIEYYSQAGRSETITLPDGSVVLTNSRTVILYAESFGEETRTLYLSGEANFKVKKNAEIPFIVKSKDFTVTALGTEFDVTSYPEDPYFKTTLISGSVKVKQNNNQTDYILGVSDQFVSNKYTRQCSITQADLYEATAWQRGELIFRGVTMKEILTMLERKYAVSFQYKSNIFNDDKFNFRFNKESTLPEIIEIIKEVSDDFEYKKTGDSYCINTID